MKVAVIGSFKQHYSAVLSAMTTFREAGWTVTSPVGAEIRVPGVDFVRFTSDHDQNSDAEIQAVTLARIFEASLVYVVAPEGYVGRTTCYEVGRLMQARRPVYFSHPPLDLPIEVPEGHVRSASVLCTEINGEGDAIPFGWPRDSIIARAEDKIVALA